MECQVMHTSRTVEAIKGDLYRLDDGKAIDSAARGMAAQAFNDRIS